MKDLEEKQKTIKQKIIKQKNKKNKTKKQKNKKTNKKTGHLRIFSLNFKKLKRGFVYFFWSNFERIKTVVYFFSFKIRILESTSFFVQSAEGESMTS